MLRWRCGFGLFQVACVLALAGCQREPAGELVLAGQDPLQSVFVAWSEATTFKGVHLVTSWSNGKKAKSVGVIRPWGDNWAGSDGIREGTCGATFISKHHAITAAHCVDKNNLPNVWPSQASPFRVQQINTSALNLTEVFDQTRITGTSWPGYLRADQLTAAEGYSPVTNTCFVEVRCDSVTKWGRDACPASFNGAVVDIALINCPQRQATDFVKVAGSDSGNAPIEVWWFHEVVNLNFGTPAPYQPAGNEEHYFKYTDSVDGRSNNYHYRNDQGEHQPLPLVSWRNVNNAQYSSTGKGAVYTTANVPICHGTSGSGVFAAPVAGNWNDTEPRVLGPAIHGDTFLNTHLCENMNNATSASFDYVNVESTQKIEALVLGDR